MKKLRIFVAAIALCLGAMPALAVVRVKYDAPGLVHDGASWATAFTTIQQGIDAAATDDEVWVASGTYLEKITLKSGLKLYGGFAGSEDVRSLRNRKTNLTIIDGNNSAGTVVSVAQSATSSTTIDGFNIVRVGACGQIGIDCANGSPTIANNVLETEANSYLIKCSGGHPLIMGNRIKGGDTGVRGIGGAPWIVSNEITGCWTGIWLEQSYANIVNNTICECKNGSSGGCGVYLISSSVYLTNNIIAYNYNDYYGSQSGVTYKNNCIYANSFKGLVTGINGNINNDPKFACRYLDYHIQSDSPCRDTGLNTAVQSTWTDVDTQSRIQPLGTGTVDIGADESYGTVYNYVMPPVINPNGGVFTAPVTVSMTCATAGAEIHYTTNGQDPTASDPIYDPSNKPLLDHSVTLKAGGFKSGYSTSLVTSAVFTITGTLPPVVLSPAGGDYQSTQYVTLSCTEPGATIYYTTDGSEPTTSSQKGTQIRVDQSMTIKAMATKYQWNNTGVTTATYNICPPAVLKVDSRCTGEVHDGLSWETAFVSIGDAVGAAVRGDEIWVAAGSYGAAIRMEADVAIYGGFAGNETSRSERSIRGNVTEITGGVTIHQSCTKNSMIDGFSIRFKGIYSDRGSATISNNIISDCYKKNGYGVGFFCEDYGTYYLINNVFTRNVTESGSGSAITLRNGHVYIVNNTICGNSSSSYGAVDIVWGGATIINTIVANNTSGIHKSNSGRISFYNSCVYGNGDRDFDLYAPSPVGSNGNISVDPGFVGAAYGDFRLQPNSPCKDTGTNTNYYGVMAGEFDLDEQPRIQNGTIDMGAYESDGSTIDFMPRIVRVSTDGDDLNDGASWNTPIRTVQAGIDRVKCTGGEVWVRAGTYVECVKMGPFVYLFGGFNGQETERSQRDWSRNETILDANRQGTVVDMSYCSSLTAIDGFTIRNGICDGDYIKGAGIYCSFSSPTIANNIITGNYAKYDGGAILCGDSCAQIRDNVITNNQAGIGAGIATRDSRATISNNVISGNTAIYGGGGISMQDGSLIIENNLILRNTAQKGGGIYGHGSGRIANNTFVSNSAEDGGAVYIDQTYCRDTYINNLIAFNTAAVHVDTPSIASIMQFNCVYGSTGYDYSPTDLTGTNGNFSADPLFVDRQNGNYNLSAGSPCIDAADPSSVLSTDMNGDTRPADGNDDGSTLVDVGCYEFGHHLYVALNAVKSLPDGSSLALTGPVVSAAFDDRFYMQGSNRVCGTAVLGVTAPVGRQVTVEGTVNAVDGERVIRASSVAIGAPSPLVKPFLVNCDAVGGGVCGLQQGMTEWRPVKDQETGKVYRAVVSCGGANNIGLLLKITGRISYVDNDCFYVDGGGVSDDGSGHKGVKVLRLSILDNVPAVGSYVVVNGISSCYGMTDYDGHFARMIRPVSLQVIPEVE